MEIIFLTTKLKTISLGYLKAENKNFGNFGEEEIIKSYYFGQSYYFGHTFVLVFAVLFN